VRQDRSFAKNQEAPPALLVVVQASVWSGDVAMLASRTDERHEDAV
jgi:hypothetical protein